MTHIYTYLVGLFAATSLLLAWFHSGLPIHAIGFLRILGFRKNDTDFWTALNNDWQMTLNVYYPNLLSELLTCPVCLSFHVSFWVGVASFLLDSELPLVYPVITAASWPVLANLILKQFKS